MTKNSIALLCFVFFGIGSSLSFVYNKVQEHEINTEKCSSTIIAFHDDIQADITLDFMYNVNKKTGVLAINGTYSKNNKHLGSIRQDIAYLWTENKDNFLFHSVAVNKIISDESLSDEQIGLILPDFFIYPNKSISYTVQQQGPNDYMFSVGGRPVFLCSH